MVSILDEIGKKISRMRKYKKISQKTLAQKSNLSQSFISHLEQGKRNPTINTIQKISQGLNIPLNKFLLYIAGNKNANWEVQNGPMEREKSNDLKSQLQKIRKKVKENGTIFSISNELDEEISKKSENEKRGGG